MERGTKIWEQLFVPRLKEKDKAEKLERHYQPLIVAPSLGLAALLETRYKFINFGKSEHVCVFRMDDLVCYETELAALNEELGRLNSVFDDETNAIDMMAIEAALDSMLDFSGSTIDSNIIEKFVCRITPVDNGHYRWDLNFAPNKK